MNDVVKNDLLTGMLAEVQSFQVIKPDDMKFLAEHKEHLTKVFTSVHQWRTDAQKESILFDEYYPSIHSKFHQAINEQRVQLDQAFYLAKDFEMKKLDIEELEAEIKEIGEKGHTHYHTTLEKIKIKKKQLEINFKMYELKQLEISM